MPANSVYDVMCSTSQSHHVFAVSAVPDAACATVLLVEIEFTVHDIEVLTTTTKKGTDERTAHTHGEFSEYAQDEWGRGRWRVYSRLVLSGGSHVLSGCVQTRASS